MVKFREDDWTAEGETRVMLLQRQTLQSQRIVLPRICIQRFITKEVEGPAVEFARAATRPQVEPASGSASVFGRKLIANKLNFLDGFKSLRMPSMTPIASLYAAIPISGVLVALFTIEQMVNGWRRGFADPAGGHEEKRQAL